MAAHTVRHRFQLVDHHHKLDALCRLLESETFDGMLVFVRTRSATAELAQTLAARGHSSAPLSGEMAQRARERTVEQFKEGKLDILVATDVAARGLDVDRISHVINFDAPQDAEAYVHRTGRTGRAGRTGEAILLLTRRERGMLRVIERATSTPLEPLTLPSTDEINERRTARFKERVLEAAASEQAPFFTQIIAELVEESGKSPLVLGGALAALAQGDQPLHLEQHPAERSWGNPSRGEDEIRHRSVTTEERPRQDRGANDSPPPGHGRERFCIQVGRIHGVKPANIVGAIASEAELEGRNIGRIEIHECYSTVDLPANMPPEIFRHLQGIKICSQLARISRVPADHDHSAGTDTGSDRSRSERRGRPNGKAPGDFSRKPRKPHRKGRSKQAARAPDSH